jgi:anti-sigma factor RsiW
MTAPKIPVTEDELHAYVDNELPAERRGDVEAWLAGHPDDAVRVQSWRAMADALHARYDSVADEAVPKRLEIERLVRQPRKLVYGAIAASLVAFIAGGGVGWLAHGAAASPSAFQALTVDALDAHRL